MVNAQRSASVGQQLRIVSYGGDLQTFLGQLPGFYDVTIGLEVEPSQPRSYVAFEVHNATFDDVMNAIVKAKPVYSWRKAGSVIEVYPTNGTNPLLDLTVSSFHVKDVIAVEALNQLLGLNEVQAAMNASQLKPQSEMFTPSTNPGSRVTIDLQKAKLRDILSRIAADSGVKFWSFQRSGPLMNSFSITFVK
jgi:hypothetical protein